MTDNQVMCICNTMMVLGLIAFYSTGHWFAGTVTFVALLIANGKAGK